MPSDLKVFDDIVKGQRNTISDYSDSFSPAGDFRRLTGINVLVKSIRSLLLTCVGTYPWDPEYGSDLYKKVWEPLDSYSEDEIYREIVGKIKIYDDRIQIEKCDIIPFNDKKGYQVNIVIKYEGEKAELDVSFHQDSGLGLE